MSYYTNQYEASITSMVEQYIRLLEAKLAIANVLLPGMREEETEGFPGFVWDMCRDAMTAGRDDLDMMICILKNRPVEATPTKQIINLDCNTQPPAGVKPKSECRKVAPSDTGKKKKRSAKPRNGAEKTARKLNYDDDGTHNDETI